MKTTRFKATIEVEYEVSEETFNKFYAESYDEFYDPDTIVNLDTINIKEDLLYTGSLKHSLNRPELANAKVTVEKL